MKMNNRVLFALFFLPAAAVILSGCKEEPKVVEQTRSIKTITVSEIAAVTERSFSGLVQATDSSALSFEVAGLVAEVNVDIGDIVEKDQVLAVIDKEPYALKVQAARAELGKAKAARVRAKADFAREENIFKEGAGSQKRLDQAKYAYDEAKAAIDYAVSSLNLVRRDLRKTVMKAPYTGTIGKRFVDPHVEVAAGEKIFQIDAAGKREALVNIPENVVNQIQIGDETDITFTASAGKPLKGNILYIGTVADEANAFPVKVALVDPPPEIHSGMTAEVTFHLAVEGGGSGFLLPVAAMVPAKDPGVAHVFRFDATSSTVQKTPIRMSGVINNMAIVAEGVSSGDVVAVAGLSFLISGQKVKLMAPKKSAPKSDFIIK